MRQYAPKFHWNRYPGQRWISVADPQNPTWYGPCCYVIQENGVAIYVGSTLDFKKRMLGHRKTLLPRLEGKVTIKIHRGHRYGDWAMREMRLIKRLNPIYNFRAY